MSAGQQELLIIVDRDNFMTTFFNVEYYTQYNCCVEVLYTDSSENAQACLVRSTEESGNHLTKNFNI